MPIEYEIYGEVFFREWIGNTVRERTAREKGAKVVKCSESEKIT